MKTLDRFDYYVLSNHANIDETVNKVQSIIDVEHHKIGRGATLAKEPLVFLCHAKEDKQRIRKLYHDLKIRGINPWLDEIDILPGQDWDYQIRLAIQKSDYFVICLSHNTVNKRGYVQKEIVLALEEVDKMPEGKIFLIPARLEECDVPNRIAKHQWVDLYDPQGIEKLVASITN